MCELIQIGGSLKSCRIIRLAFNEFERKKHSHDLNSIIDHFHNYRSNKFTGKDTRFGNHFDLLILVHRSTLLPKLRCKQTLLFGDKIPFLTLKEHDIVQIDEKSAKYRDLILLYFLCEENVSFICGNQRSS